MGMDGIILGWACWYDIGVVVVVNYGMGMGGTLCDGYGWYIM